MPLGSAPQLAVKRGLGMKYNVERVVGVLGGSVYCYLLHGDKRLSLADVDPSLVGRKVCTKAVGGGVAHQLKLKKNFHLGFITQNQPESCCDQYMGMASEYSLLSCQVHCHHSS